MLGMNTTNIVHADWDLVVNLLPEDLEQTAEDKLALVRRREITSAQDLLRLCLAYGLCDMSLRQTAAWAEVSGIGSLSDVAVLKRLRNSADWLEHLIMQWMDCRGLQPPGVSAGVRILDATAMCGPGSTGTDWRLHLGLDLQQMRISSTELTGPEEAENFMRHQFEPGEIIVADRGYAHRRGVAELLEADAHTVVRINWQSFPLLSAQGKPLDIIECGNLLAVGEIGDWPVAFESNGIRYPMRLVAIRKTAEATEKERKRLRRIASRKGRKPAKDSMRAAEFIFVITDLSAEMLPAVEALQLYRMRWQIEIFFKRLKGILDIGQLRAKDPQLARTYLYANILSALILDELRQWACLFSPWGYPLRPRGAQRMAAVSDAG